MFRFLQGRKTSQRVLILGLDCASPQLVFEQFREELPTLHHLMKGGSWGILKSSIPCITVPAWASMTSSRDPGVLGIYGFRNRADSSYDALTTADARAVEEKRLWDYLGEAGKQSLVLNVPQTFPVQPIKGHMVSCFLTPNTGAQFAYPAIFKQEVLKHFPNYSFDVRDFRNVERAELYQGILDLTNTQYSLLEYALKNKEWDFAMHVNIGVDRIHHAFWRYHDPQHRLHEPESPFRHAIRDYYKLVDNWLGRILPLAEDAAILVVSDHGAKRMDGAIAINEWLWQNGWLALKENPDGLTKFDPALIDWSKTRAWSTGGYYGRIFLNVEGREAEGTIPQANYEAVRDELAACIEAIPDENGQALNTQVFKPEAIYQQVKGNAPDLMVYFGDLHWRCVGGFGYGRHTTFENDTGPDDANHAEEGLFILHQSNKAGQGQIEAHQLMDVAPTVLALMGLPIPKTMQGKIIS